MEQAKGLAVYDFHFFSPERTLNVSWAVEKGIQLSIKRDDLIHPYISGNKWRKLKYILERANKEQKTHLVTFGGAWSNHLLATACAAASFNFKCTGYVRGEEVENPVLSLCRTFGMQLEFLSREAYKDKESVYASRHTEGDTIFIEEGGYSIEAANGCEEIILELAGDYDHMFCACGTGTTLAGLSKGASATGIQVHGVPVLKGGDFIRDAVHAIYPELNFKLHTGYHFGGYAKATPGLISFIKEFTRETGILIEPVYTGKLLFALKDLITNGYFKPGTRILVLHTGGLTGFLGHFQKF